MFTHEQVWHGIDRLARERGLTASGLARRAGLDPTTFNPSKRVTKQRKPRWPSTESLAKILNATETSLDDFVALMADRPLEATAGASHRLRCIGMDQAARPELFDEAGFPVGPGWDEIDFPNLEDPNAYALEVRGDDFLPTYRDGDLVVVSPTAGIRRRDRIMLRTKAGAIIAATLLRRTAQRIEIAPVAADPEAQVLPVREVAWLARIVWVSQ
jgi:phage repressor protein C with HTH and peptisase S24 domain